MTTPDAPGGVDTLVGPEPWTGVIERVAGSCGELVLRRRGPDLEVVANGAFLISTANDRSSRAMIGAALPYARGDRLEVLIGGLGLGYALDEALASPRVAHVTVAELEPAIVRWFRTYGEGRATRAARGERGGRARIALADVVEMIAAGRARFDLIALDTDNGPEWLVRDANAGLYNLDGVRRVREALRSNGVALYGSPDRYPDFAALLAEAFARVVPVAAHDVVAGRRHEYTMYVALRDA